MAKSDGFKSVETDEESLLTDKENKKRNIKICLLVLLLIILAAVATTIWMELRTYTNFEIKDSKDAPENNAKKYLLFTNKIVEYSNDGILCRDDDWNLVWNQSFEMAAPKVDVCEDYLVVYDERGSELYIMNKAGLVKKLDMSRPIYKARVANQGTVAVLMKEKSVSYLKMFDSDGKELTNGAFYEDQGSYPIDIAISNDAKKLALDMIETKSGELVTSIRFYNFGSVGQNEVNNEVSSQEFKGILFPEIKYVSNDKLLAIGDTEYAVFEGTQKPALTGEYPYDENVQSLCYNNKYVCFLYSNNDDNNTFHIKVMDLKGKSVMDQNTEIPYNSVEFLENNEICVRSKLDCEIYTIHGIKKFAYTFDNELYKVLSGRDRQSYTFVIEKTIEEVRLK